jgi:hypothetical protein
MKKILLFLLLISSISFSQNASTYFPSNLGYKWYYKNVSLDSNNNPISGSTTYRIDSFAVIQMYKGLLANVVRFKDNLTSLNQNTPYNDTTYYNFQTTIAWVYTKILSRLPGFDTTGFGGFISSLENWYNIFRFANTINLSYIIFTKDTTIVINSVTLPLRVTLAGKRLNDENVTVETGTYPAKKFIITQRLGYLITFPITIEIPILTRPDTVYISSGIWVVKESIPFVKIDLSILGYPIIPIPGKVTQLTNPSIGITPISNIIPSNYKLYQNYPNPFNSISKIKYQISKVQIKNQKVKLDLFNSSGQIINILVNEEQEPGIYEVTFDGSNLSSGTYFYRLSIGDYSETKKLILLK